jgi:hypothetical protein
MANVEYDKAAALKAAKKLFRENAIVWEDGDLKCVGADSSIYNRETLKTTSWKKFIFNGKVRLGICAHMGRRCQVRKQN